MKCYSICRQPLNSDYHQPDTDLRESGASIGEDWSIRYCLDGYRLRDKSLC